MKAKITKCQIIANGKITTIKDDLIKPNRYQSIERTRKKIKSKYECENVFFNYVERQNNGLNKTT